MIFESAKAYVLSQTSITAKVAAIDAIIEALLATALDAAGADNLKEYQLNDGQTIIRSTYKGVDQIHASINAFHKLREYYVNQSIGRVSRFMDSKNFQ